MSVFNSNKQELDQFEKFRDFIEDYYESEGIEKASLVELSPTQQKALDIFKRGENLLIIGEGGTGKSWTIREFKYQTQKEGRKTIAISATTGIAAWNINGVTIQSFMGIGTGELDINTIIQRVTKKRHVCNRIRNTDIIVIDEVSMASASLFEKLNAVCQHVRRNNRPFGGMQIVLTGDLLQLCPVFHNYATDTRLIFESPLFQSMFNIKRGNIVVLKSNFRQNDTKFKQLLGRIRRGDVSKDDLLLLEERKKSSFPLDTIHLVSSNHKARSINEKELANLHGVCHSYPACYDTEGVDKDMCEFLKNDLYQQFEKRGLNNIVLKCGARVVLVKNIDVDLGLVNGSAGTVVDFVMESGLLCPSVRFDNGAIRTISPTKWEISLNGSACFVSQIPLMLGWSLTIHKCQSLTLDRAVLDLSDCFAEAQVYVALSRLRSLDGVYLKSFDPKRIKVNQDVLDYVTRLENV